MRNDALTIDLMRKIIIHEIDIAEERVNIYNQRFRIPPDDGLFIYLEYRGTPGIISSRNGLEIVEGEYSEVQDLNTLEDVTVGLYSKGLDALRMQYKVQMCLNSIYSQQLQEQESFKIFPNSKIIPLSVLEGAALLYRFDIEVRAMAWYNNIKPADYFNTYSVRVRVNDGTPDLVSEFAVADVNPTAYPKT